MPPIASSEVTVGTTATLICTVLPGQNVELQNMGSTTVYLGNTSAVTTSNAGSELSVGGTANLTCDPDNPGGDKWYGVVASGTTTVGIEAD